MDASLLPVLALLVLAVLVVIVLLRFMRSRHPAAAPADAVAPRPDVPPAPLSTDEQEYLDSSHISAPAVDVRDADAWRSKRK